MNARRLRRTTPVVLVVGAVVVVALLLGVFAPRWWGGESGSYAPRTPAVAGSIEPRQALFGDVLTARASVVVDADKVDASTLRVYPAFAPYRVVSTIRTVEPLGGAARRVDTTFRLQCLTTSCLDAMEETREGGKVVATPIRFRPGEIVASTPAGREWRGEVPWPAVLVGTRVTSDELADGRPRTPPLALPAASYRVEPGLLGWGLVVLASVLVLAGAALIASVVRGRDAPRRLRLPERLTPIDRALALARHAAASGDVPGERRALERLAAELRRQGDGDLAIAAQRLAWSEDTPVDDALDELEAEVSRMGNGR